VSNGVIAFRRVPYTGEIQYLMICRKNTLGYIDFLRGKYSVYNKNYILNMMTQMTVEEKEKLRTLKFDSIWRDLWGEEPDINAPEHLRENDDIIKERAVSATPTVIKRHEDTFVRERFHMLIMGVYSKNAYYTLNSLLDESDGIAPAEGGIITHWVEPEWGFPKGRKNNQEKDLHCALREFEEETGYSTNHIRIVENMMPFEEIFTGSNYKSYKHKYYLAFMPVYNDVLPQFERGEVSVMGWFSFGECMERIRGYNIEKRRMISNINRILTTMKVTPLRAAGG
jgi:8-oxo-dGTP pyrophosphatase MutT (NUDIX family)